MSVKDIQQYLEANRGKYPLELLISELRKAGHSESEIQQALGGHAVSQMPSVSSLTTWGKVWRFGLGFLAGGAIALVTTLGLYISLALNFNFFYFGGSSSYFLRSGPYTILVIIATSLILPVVLYFFTRSKSRYFARGVLTGSLVLATVLSLLYLALLNLF